MPRLVPFVAAAFALGALLLTGCQTTPPSAADAAALEAPSGLLLAEGDVLRISFPSAPEMDTTQRIRADGRVSLPLVGEVQASGRELSQFQRDLRAKYSANLRNTEVLVSLDATASAVYVSGSVNAPGKFPLDRPMTILEAVMEAGGFSNSASPRRVTLIRREGGQYRTQIVDLSPALRNKPAPATYVRPYDVIYVPASVL